MGCRLSSGQLGPDPLGDPIDVMTPVTASGADDLMTRRQVAYLFGVTSAAVATWARRGLVPEVRDAAGRPRYRRADIEELRRRGIRWRSRRRPDGAS
jgi:MerR HTH family regulatory protein